MAPVNCSSGRESVLTFTLKGRPSRLISAATMKRAFGVNSPEIARSTPRWWFYLLRLIRESIALGTRLQSQQQARIMNSKTETDRVRRRTSPEELRKIEERIEHNVRLYAGQPDDVIAARIEDLQNEWSVERHLERNASILMLTGAVLGLAGNRKWLLLSGIVGGFLLQHAISGWCPPLTMFRKMGVRTRNEIEREIYALKAARGDFKNVPADRPKSKSPPINEILEAVNA